MNVELMREIEDSLYLHRMLPLHRERSLEAAYPQKTVTKQEMFWPGDGSRVPVGGGLGRICESREEGERLLVLRAPLRNDRWPDGAPADGDYSNFGLGEVRFELQNEDWQSYNRLHFWVKPQLAGAQVLHLNVGVVNEGKIAVPDKFSREGFTNMDLQNGEWNECFWEFTAMPRDRITALKFFVFLSGQDVGVAEELTYSFKDIRLETVERPEVEKGWLCARDSIVFSAAGYLPRGKKTAIGNMEENIFSLIETESGKAVLTKNCEVVNNEKGTFRILDFSEVTEPGMYYLQAGKIRTESFAIAADIIEENVWRALNFLYSQRCGTMVNGKHGRCHEDILAEHNGVRLSFSGGWHDAGDMSQQTAQTGETVHALFALAEKYRNNRKLFCRLVEEGKWGLDFLLRTRFGDGYRATSAGSTRWTNGLMGDMDDVAARVHNHAYENFLFAGIEGYSAIVLSKEEPGFAAGVLKIAEEDYGFARQRFLEKGIETYTMFEHTYNSGMSQYYAVLIWAASYLYEATGRDGYAADAREYGEKLLACQESGRAGLPFGGFFYRDESHRQIVHFNHQARSQQFIQALVLLCETQPDAAERPRWEAGLARYGEYLKSIQDMTAPYGMIPAGIHRTDEWQDRELFPYLHVATEYQEEKENYKEQLAGAKPLQEGYVLRHFPIWFSFRGNNVVLLSEGKAASLLGTYLRDEELLQIGREQLYWVFGKNPFGQSMMYGAGSRYCSQYAVLPGEAVGEIPVGIETLDNADEPYWPQNNNATYKEIWISAVCRWLWLAADYVD